MSQDALRQKWDRIYAQSVAPDVESEVAVFFPEPRPAEVLAENAHLLPAWGKALDLACGLGGNALFLARLGFEVTAWDISPVAIHNLCRLAGDLVLSAQVRDVENEPFPQYAFDVVVVSRFLCRPLARPILDSLKPGGMLFYQTFTQAKLNPQGPSNPDYLLGARELLGMFGSLRLLFYRDDGRVGNLTMGRRDEAYFVGQKV